jgi:hypothetical protein
VYTEREEEKKRKRKAAPTSDGADYKYIYVDDATTPRPLD